MQLLLTIISPKKIFSRVFSKNFFPKIYKNYLVVFFKKMYPKINTTEKANIEL